MGNSRSGRTAYIDKRAVAGWAENDLVLAGVHHRVTDYGYLVHASELRSITVTDLQHALADADADGADNRLHVADVELAYFDDDDNTPIGPIAFTVCEDGALVIEVIAASDFEGGDEELTRHINSIAAPLLHRHRVTLSSAAYNASYTGPPPAVVELTLCPSSTRGRTLDELATAANELADLLEASSGGELSRTPTVDLLRAGRGAVLLGQREGQWLDVKSQLYEVTTLRGKISLAQAVARFVNSDGGIVVFGMSTRKVGPGEVIDKIRPVPTDAYTVRRHRQALEAHLYPLPQGLDVELVPVVGGHLLVVHVPPQPEQSKPFLVHGAIVDGNVEGAFISIIRRSGEDSVPVTAPAIHASMSLSRLVDRLTVGSVSGRAGQPTNTPPDPAAKAPPPNRRA